MEFTLVFIKWKPRIIPTDILEDVPETHSNDNICCKVKKLNAIQPSLFKV